MRLEVRRVEARVFCSGCFRFGEGFFLIWFVFIFFDLIRGVVLDSVLFFGELFYVFFLENRFRVIIDLTILVRV